jgi:hypothetical protein
MKRMLKKNKKKQKTTTKTKTKTKTKKQRLDRVRTMSDLQQADSEVITIKHYVRQGRKRRNILKNLSRDMRRHWNDRVRSRTTRHPTIHVHGAALNDTSEHSHDASARHFQRGICIDGLTISSKRHNYTTRHHRVGATRDIEGVHPSGTWPGQ